MNIAIIRVSIRHCHYWKKQANKLVSAIESVGKADYASANNISKAQL